jgi:Skp family chaperone for outer membrane proteins
MKLVQGTLAVLGGMGLALSAWAQAPEVGSKFAFVEVERAVTTCDEGKARLKELEIWAKPLQDELARLNKAINDAGAELNAKRASGAPDDALADLNRTLVAKQREFEDRQRVAKRDFEARQNDVLKDLGSKISDVVAAYAKENNFTAVFIFKPNELIYLNPGADITSAVVKLYNEKYPYSAAASAK